MEWLVNILVSNGGERAIATLIAAVVPLLFYWLFVLIYAIVPKWFPAHAKKYKIQASSTSDHHSGSGILISGGVLLNIVCNQLFFVIGLVWVLYPLLVWRGCLLSLSRLPSFPEAIGHVVLLFLIQDTLFYWLHRVLHMGWVYKRIHRYHHQFSSPTGVCANVAHPVEYLVAFALPIAVGIILLGTHFVVFSVFLSLMFLHNVQTHCGYNYPWDITSLLTSNDVTLHDDHHDCNHGNYSGGVTDWWDRLCGTKINKK